MCPRSGDKALKAAVMVTAVRYHDIKKQMLTGGSADRGLRLTVKGAGSSTQAFWPLENKWISLRSVVSRVTGVTTAEPLAKPARERRPGGRAAPGRGPSVSSPPLPPCIPGPHQPSLSAAFTLTPKSSRNRTMWWCPAQTALCRGVMPSSLGLLGSSTCNTGTWHVSPAGGRQGCCPTQARAHLVDNPLHQVEFPLQRRVQKQCQWVEADPQAVSRPLRVGLLQVGPLVLWGGSVLWISKRPQASRLGAEGRRQEDGS